MSLNETLKKRKTLNQGITYFKIEERKPININLERRESNYCVCKKKKFILDTETNFWINCKNSSWYKKTKLKIEK